MNMFHWFNIYHAKFMSYPFCFLKTFNHFYTKECEHGFFTLCRYLPFLGDRANSKFPVRQETVVNKKPTTYPSTENIFI